MDNYRALLDREASLEELRHWYGQAAEEYTPLYSCKFECSCIIGDEKPLLVLDAVEYETLLYQGQMEIDELLDEQMREWEITENSIVPVRPASPVQNWVLWAKVRRNKFICIFLISVPEAQQQTRFGR